MNLHLNSKNFSEAIQAASQHLKIREVFIEKDYWVCFVIKNLSHSKFKNKVVFKGGTSLSKAYRGIHRFSEDVDLALISAGENDNRIKKIIKEVESQIALSPLAEVTKNGVTSKGSRFRKTVWEFKKTSTGDYGDASPDLLLEINSFTQPFPHQEMKVRSYIADFLIAQADLKTIAEFGLEDISVNVLNYKRTFAEKVSAVARACFESDANLNEVKKKIRHLYDLTMLLRIPEIEKFIDDGEFSKIHQQVQRDDANVSDQQISATEQNWKEAIVFKNPAEALSLLVDTYEKQFATLLFDADKKPALIEIEKAMRNIAK